MPTSCRKALGIKAGDEMTLRAEGDELRITMMKRKIEHAQRRVRKYVKPGVSLADELIAERRFDAIREQEERGCVAPKHRAAGVTERTP